MTDLVVFYSLSGKGRQVAAWLAAELKADLAEIVETRPRSFGPGGMVRCVLDSVFRREPPIRPMGPRAGPYDRVILCAPVWAGRLAGPARTWLHGDGTGMPLVLALQSGSGGNAAAMIGEVEALTGRRPDQVLSTTEADFGKGLAEQKVRAFAGALGGAAASVPAKRPG